MMFFLHFEDTDGVHYYSWAQQLKKQTTWDSTLIVVTFSVIK